jgi:hypothetical protein
VPPVLFLGPTPSPYRPHRERVTCFGLNKSSFRDVGSLAPAGCHPVAQLHLGHPAIIGACNTTTPSTPRFALILISLTSFPRILSSAEMSLQSAADVPLLIVSSNSSSERRISPSWSIAQLKARLEPITGVPASCQQLSLRVGSQDAVPLIAADEEQTRLAAFPLQPYAEITVSASSTTSNA